MHAKPHLSLTSLARRPAVQALASVKAKVGFARTVGLVTGAAGTFIMLQRRKAGPPSWLRMAGLCTMGSIVTGSLFVPLGIYYGRRDLQNVEDPKHLIGVLRSARDAAQRNQRAPQTPGQGGSGQGETARPGQPPAPIARQEAASMPNTNQWGDDVGAAETAYSNDFANAPSPDTYTRPMSSASSGSPSMATSSVQSASYDDGAGRDEGKSRWDQLRRERGVQASGWDRIRQQNAKETYSRQSASGQGQPGQAAYPSEQTPNSDYRRQQPNEGLADATFGKSISASREQAQREYERSFERERRGVDG